MEPCIWILLRPIVWVHSHERFLPGADRVRLNWRTNPRSRLVDWNFFAEICHNFDESTLTQKLCLNVQSNRSTMTLFYTNDGCFWWWQWHRRIWFDIGVFFLAKRRDTNFPSHAFIVFNTRLDLTWACTSVLFVGRNSLTRTIPSELGRLTSIQHLHLCKLLIGFLFNMNFVTF